MNTSLIVASWPLLLAAWFISRDTINRERMRAGREAVWERRGAGAPNLGDSRET